MRLADLEQYDPITIQCHDNPDGDAIGAGFGLYRYFQTKGKNVRLIYSGRLKIQKTNLLLFIEHLAIPIEYIENPGTFFPGLLVTVDCQYGAGNVTKFNADAAAFLDHHQPEITNMPLGMTNPALGSCSTLVWNLMKEEGFSFNEDTVLGTALYYGLFTDTNQFSEISNPLDMDMRDSLPHSKSLIRLFKNSNLSLSELEIAGIALIRYIYNDDYKYAIIRSQPCDPNILGLISDFLLQVDSIHVGLVYNELEDGYKLSIRSCIKEVMANELAAYLTKGIGSGGGHMEKAGGFISKKKYEELYPTLHTEGYFSDKLHEYFDSIDIIYARKYDIDLRDMACFEKKKIHLGFVKSEEILPIGTPITIRTLEGDVDTKIDPDFYIMIGIKGEVYPIKKEKFSLSYHILSDPYRSEAIYTPTVKNRITGEQTKLIDFAHTCIATGAAFIYAKELTKTIKIFTAWDEEKYMLGNPGDFIAVRCDDLHDIYIVERDIFFKTYDQRR